MSTETAATEAVEEVIEAVAENPAKVLAFAVGLAGAALVTWWAVKRLGIAAQLAADDSGLFDPPAFLPDPREVFAPDDDELVDPEHQPAVWGDHRPAGAEFMGG